MTLYKKVQCSERLPDEFGVYNTDLGMMYLWRTFNNSARIKYWFEPIEASSEVQAFIDEWKAMAEKAEAKALELQGEVERLREQIKTNQMVCYHDFVSKDAYWKQCIHCGLLEPII